MSEEIAQRALEAGAAAGFDVAEGGAGLVVQSASGVIEAATPEAEAILGLTLAQMLGRDSADERWAAVDEAGAALRGQDHPAMRAISTGIAVRGAVMGVHRPGHDAPGEHVWLLVDSVPLITPGAPTVAVTRFALMTGPRATELRLAASERLYRWLVDNAPDMVAWQLPDTTFIWVSKVCRSLLGRAPEEMIGTTVYDYVHPDDLAALHDAESKVRTNAGLASLLLRMRHRDGHYVWTEAAGQVLADADGNASQVRTAWRDVTARVIAEQERDAALRLLQSAAESSPIGIAVCLLDGTFEHVNSSLCSMLARGRSELLGSNLRDLLHPDDDECADVLNPRQIDSEGHETERRYLRGDGSWMWGHHTLVDIRDADGHGSRRRLLHVRDVTARRQALDELAHLATHDPLTGLANRSALNEHLAQSARRLGPGDRSALLFIDVDDFKTVNDQHGHQVGDMLLRQMGERLCNVIREHDFAARLGGDEFVVYCAKVQDRHKLSTIAQRVSAELSRRYEVGAHTMHLSVSVGVTTVRGACLDELVARADQAMYRAKRAGRGLIAIDDLVTERSASYTALAQRVIGERAGDR
ncbi:sensor domain-containing diguanylate cyclase [Mycolicibacterium sp.]|uniref:sensor domain-containing protein n=1 Tax=Mycolicibacterium sp. TaxID=2320850 RepID=UPI001A27C1DB|nr:sensor domain-containing diguanylate cyclase [Mycolicibacterium sp.]MBJ7340961.1 sensor domain-containing diguanylate cyclase [Mycolicibacterium sp.]